jgi:hypothetical protein
LSSGLKFVLGVDIVKDNIYNAKNGAYARVVREYSRSFKQRGQEQVKFPDIAFAVGDCTLDIRSGEAGMDEESKKLLKMIMKKDNKRYEEHYKNIVGKGADKFDAITCLFAIHYFFENEEKINTFLNNVSSMLKVGGTFICTFMDGKSVAGAINANGGDMVEGRKKLNKRAEDKGVPLWAIIRRYNSSDAERDFNNKVDVYIEATKKFIPEFIVDFDVLIRKCKEYNIELVESELFSQTFNKIKARYTNPNVRKNNIYNIISDLDKEEELKQFSFFNRWCIFKKV